MIRDDSARLTTVRKLLELSEPLDVLTEQLSSFPWDYDKIGIELNRGHIRNALERYLRGDMTPEQVENWANTIEGRDDIDLGSTPDPILEDVIHELANPTLTEILTERRAVELLKTLAPTE
jgi:hypothetical protein